MQVAIRSGPPDVPGVVVWPPETGKRMGDEEQAMSAVGDSPVPTGSVAEVLNYLFEHNLPPDAHKRIHPHYTNRELAAFIRRRTGGRCTEAYISKLRNGDTDVKVSFEKLQAAAEFFDVTVGVFDPNYRAGLDELRAQLELAAAWHESDLRVEAARAFVGLSSEEAAAVRAELTELMRTIQDRRADSGGGAQ